MKRHNGGRLCSSLSETTSFQRRLNEFRQALVTRTQDMANFICTISLLCVDPQKAKLRCPIDVCTLGSWMHIIDADVNRERPKAFSAGTCAAGTPWIHFSTWTSILTTDLWQSLSYWKPRGCVKLAWCKMRTHHWQTQVHSNLICGLPAVYIIQYRNCGRGVTVDLNFTT